MNARLLMNFVSLRAADTAQHDSALRRGGRALPRRADADHVRGVRGEQLDRPQGRRQQHQVRAGACHDPAVVAPQRVRNRQDDRRRLAGAGNGRRSRRARPRVGQPELVPLRSRLGSALARRRSSASCRRRPRRAARFAPLLPAHLDHAHRLVVPAADQIPAPERDDCERAAASASTARRGQPCSPAGAARRGGAAAGGGSTASSSRALGAAARARRGLDATDELVEAAHRSSSSSRSARRASALRVLVFTVPSGTCSRSAISARARPSRRARSPGVRARAGARPRRGPATRATTPRPAPRGRPRETAVGRLHRRLRTAASAVDNRVARHRVEPGAARPALRVVASSGTPDRGERFLERVLGPPAVSETAQGEPEHRPGVTPVQLLERVALTAAGALDQLPVRRPGAVPA